MNLQKKMLNRIVSVVGLGYVGLPVAVAFGKIGHTIGFDVNTLRISELNRGVDTTKEVSSDELKFADVKFSSNPADLRLANFHIVAVPTPVDDANTPDLTPVIKATKTIASQLKIGDIVVYESTVYPGVTEDICIPILEDISKLKSGVDFKVGYSPERINPGDKERPFTKIKKIVSGQDDESLEVIASVYACIIEAGVYKASSIKVAEAAKVIENTQRDINIALMNELAVIFERMQIDTKEVLDAASTKWNFLQFKPGLVGGHCIGVDPYYLTHKAQLMGYIPQVILAGRRINDNMGRYVARRAVKQLIKNNHSMQDLQVVVLGATFKENCPDTRNSKVIDIIREFEDYNAKVFVHDPIADKESMANHYGIIHTDWENLPKVNLLVVAVSHDCFTNKSIDELCALVNPNGIIFDVKSILPKQDLLNRGYHVCRL